MKIFYAVQATGNGHIARAIELLPYLQCYGTVHVFLSGSNSSLPVNSALPIEFTSKGVSLMYSKSGGLNYWKTIKNCNPIKVYREAKQLPIEQFDVVINDFDCITSLACRLKKISSISFGHQACFKSLQTPRPQKRDALGEAVLQHFAPATKYIGLHFESYDSFIHPPIIKDEILQATPMDLNHITVYLPSFDKECLEKAFHKLPQQEFHWFLGDVKFKHKIGNITYYPVNQKDFNESLIHCHGIITGGGFETPAEALYLKKKVLSIPILNHYEQECNAAALKKLGVPVLYEVGKEFELIIENWLNENAPIPTIQANNIPETLQFLFDTYQSS